MARPLSIYHPTLGNFPSQTSFSFSLFSRVVYPLLLSRDPPDGRGTEGANGRSKRERDREEDKVRRKDDEEKKRKREKQVETTMTSAT